MSGEKHWVKKGDIDTDSGIQQMVDVMNTPMPGDEFFGKLFGGSSMDLKTKFLEAIKANVCFTCCALRLPEERHDAVEKVFLAAADLSWDYGSGAGVSREVAYTASEAAIDLVFQFVEVAPDKQSIIKVGHQMLWSYFWPERPLIGDPADRALQVTLLTALTGLKIFAMLTPTRRDDMAIDLLIKIITTEWESLAAIIDKAEGK